MNLVVQRNQRAQFVDLIPRFDNIRGQLESLVLMAAAVIHVEQPRPIQVTVSLKYPLFSFILEPLEF